MTTPTEATAPPDDRTDPPYVGGERAVLEGFLDFHRETLLWKCAGLTPEQLRLRPIPSTNLSLLGLVRHLAAVERSWFRQDVAGEDVPALYYTRAEPDRDIDPPPEADPEADFAAFRAEVEACRAAARDRDLDSTFVTPTRPDHLAALALRAHGRGICAAQRPRRPDPAGDRRRDRGMR